MADFDPMEAARRFAEMEAATAEFEALRQRANQQMSPFAPPQPNAPAGPAPSWPGLLNYGQIPDWAASKVPDMSFATDNAVGRYVGRGLEALGRAPGDVYDMGPVGAVQGAIEASAAFPSPLTSTGAATHIGDMLRLQRVNPDVMRGAVTGDWAPIREASRARETSIMRAPPHTIQKRGPGGRFQKLEGETREIRDKAIRDRARQKAKPEHRPEYDDFGEPLGSKAARDYLSKI